jgi:truncated hemoglobin YjbI
MGIEPELQGRFLEEENMRKADAQVLINRQRFVNRLAEMEMTLRSMARVSNFSKDMCKDFESLADHMQSTIAKTRKHIEECVT